MIRAGSPDVGEVLCRPILTKIGIVVDSFRCTICNRRNRPRTSTATVPSLSPLVRQLRELGLLPHSHGPTPIGCVSISIGVIKLATSTRWFASARQLITGTKPRAEIETAR